jgi:hypothetical protein
MEAPAVLAAYRSSRALIAALAALHALTVAGTAGLVAADGGWRGTWMTAAAGAYALAALFIAWVVLRVSGRSLVIHSDWFDYRTPREFLQARWDQVDTVWATASGVVGRRGLFGRYEYHLEIAGRRLDAGTAVGADAGLGRLVAEHTLPHLLDRSVARLRSGRTVRFGTLTLEPNALVVRAFPHRRIDLDHLSAHRLAHRRLAIEVKGRRRPLQVRLSRVPNAWVLMDLLDRRADWQAGPRRHRAQRPNSARAKNQRLAGRSAMRRVR